MVAWPFRPCPNDKEIWLLRPYGLNDREFYNRKITLIRVSVMLNNKTPKIGRYILSGKFRKKRGVGDKGGKNG